MCRKPVAVTPTLMLLCLLSAGCSDEEEFASTNSTSSQSDFAPVMPVPDRLSHGIPTEGPSEMLTVADPTPPERWLLSLHQLRDSPDTARSSAHYHRLLQKIKPHVHEDRRVIANRAVQITHQLRDRNIEADQDDILQSFAVYLERVPGKYVFGELCANYSNLRQQGLSHEEAMRQLFDLI